MGEDLIACFERRDGFIILPAYEKESQTGKGPRLYLPFGSGHRELIVPDLLGKRGGEIAWIEAKLKKHFTWHARSGHWQTGIDQRHYEDYLKVLELTQWDVWLRFLHMHDTPPRSKWADGLGGGHPQPLHCPTGLYGGSLSRLLFLVDHVGSYVDEEGRRTCQMVYWNYEDLDHLATLQEVKDAWNRASINEKENA
jgi:hypothetical protein